jgi:hypothetical protein
MRTARRPFQLTVAVAGVEDSLCSLTGVEVEVYLDLLDFGRDDRLDAFGHAA